MTRVSDIKIIRRDEKIFKNTLLAERKWALVYNKENYNNNPIMELYKSRYEAEKAIEKLRECCTIVS